MKTVALIPRVLATLSLGVALAINAIAPTAAASRPPAHPTAAQGATGQLDAYFQRLVHAHAFRGAVLIARGNTIVLSKGYDVADVAHGRPNTPHTAFRIGSITDQFTAAAILQLQDSGKLRLQDHVCPYVAPCPKAWGPITIEQLLVGSAGIPDYRYASAPNTLTMPTALRNPTTVAYLLALIKSKPLDFKPGTALDSVNSTYVVLGYIIEKVSRQSYADYLLAHVIRPLGLTQTGFGQGRYAVAQQAAGYASWRHPSSASIDVSVPYASGALYSTVEDLYRFDQALRGGKIFSRASVGAMFSPRKVYCPRFCALGQSAGGMGYAWDISTQNRRESFGWASFLPGFASVQEIYPANNATIIVLTNMDGVNLQAITKTCQTALFGRP